MTKVAIVGATGPTGIHLAAELRKTAAAVRVVARGMDKLARLFPDAAVEKRPADILDADATLRAIDGCDLVYDCIGLPGDQMHLHPATARNIAGALRHTKARCAQVSSYWAYYPQARAEMNESHPRSGGPPWVGKTVNWLGKADVQREYHLCPGRHAHRRRYRRPRRGLRRALVPARRRPTQRPAGRQNRGALSSGRRSSCARPG